MRNTYEYCGGGVIVSPSTSATNTITVSLDNIENGVFIGYPQAGGTWRKMSIFAEIMLLGRGSSSITGLGIRRAACTCPDGVTGSPGSLRINWEENVHLTWPFTNVDFNASNILSGSTVTDRRLLISFGISSGSISEVLWELKLKAIATTTP